MSKSHFQSERIFWWAAGVILLLAVLSRFLFLDMKAFHHDESLHAYYSNRVANGNVHEYSALLHGPFLYYFVGLIMWVFGSTDEVARGAAALFGVFIIALPLLTRRLLGPVATLSLMALLLISPSFLYFGRFLREDAFTTVWVLGAVLGGLVFWLQRKPWALYFSTAMMAFHFVNKENSYLHSALWLLAMVNIAYFGSIITRKNKDQFETNVDTFSRQSAFSKKDKIYLILNVISLFATIFILFYSSFFRHSKGAWHGVLDGLYRESLLYWWDQNQKRRIDGPFDYHLPIIANYEFLIFPFLALAWMRVLQLSRVVRSFFANSKLAVGSALALTIASFVLPRVAFVADACSYTDFCLESLSKPIGDLANAFAKPIHISHSRHLLQILAYIAIGAIGLFCSLSVARKFDAFVWFWVTGALGVYSYVGEKVPWLTLYILLPLIVLVGLECGRFFARSPLPIDPVSKDPELADALLQKETRLFSRMRFTIYVWLILAVPFTVFKGVRASFWRADDPRERLVFTQTTPLAHQVRNRWRSIAATKPKDTRFRVGMAGDATWPFAWYTEEFKAGDFAKPTRDNAHTLDVILMDFNLLEEARREFLEFQIYELSMRHWWVPGQNPTLAQIAKTFFTGEVYPREREGSDTDTGVGDTKILYLEKRGSLFFQNTPEPEFLKKL
jgi:uncharacterized protein (TIGR03663 family)